MTGERETCIYHVSNSSDILEVSERHIIPAEQPTVGAQAHRWQTAFRKQTPSSYITNIFMKLNDTKTLLSCIIVLCCVRSFGSCQRSHPGKLELFFPTLTRSLAGAGLEV